MQFRLFPIVLFALAACGTKSSSNPKLPDNTPSVILVSIDSLRADHTTPYGYQAKFSGEPTTPFMAKLASEGVLWENASSAAPWTGRTWLTYGGMGVPGTRAVLWRRWRASWQRAVPVTGLACFPARDSRRPRYGPARRSPRTRPCRSRG